MIIMLCLLLCLFLLMSLSEACSCAPRLIQQHYCDAHFVARVSPFQEEVIAGTRVYTVSIIRPYKLSPDAELALGERKIHTAEHGSLCGIFLTKGEDYLVAGYFINGVARVSLCDLAIPWNALTPYQQNAVQLGIYRQSCSCKVCGFLDGCGESEIPSKGCRLNDRQDPDNCYNRHSSCRLLSLSTCKWEMSTELKKCLNAPSTIP